MIKPEELVADVLYEIKRPGDYFVVDRWSRVILYSRYFSGGAFQLVAEYKFRDLKLYLGYGTNFNKAFDLANPDSYRVIGEAIYDIVRRMQVDRMPFPSQKSRPTSRVTIRG